MNRSITFCFALYNQQRTFDWHNYAAYLWDGPIIHCEVYDRHQNYAYYITSASKTVVRTKKFYGESGWIFLSVVLTPDQYTRMIEYFIEIITLRLRFNSNDIFCFPLNSCCCCTQDDTTITCSELIAGMIQRVWQFELPYHPRKYTPSDIHRIVLQLIEQGKTKKSNIQGNPNRLVHNIHVIEQ